MTEYPDEDVRILARRRSQEPSEEGPEVRRKIGVEVREIAADLAPEELRQEVSNGCGGGLVVGSRAGRLLG